MLRVISTHARGSELYVLERGSPSDRLAGRYDVVDSPGRCGRGSWQRAPRCPARNPALPGVNRAARPIVETGRNPVGALLRCGAGERGERLFLSYVLPTRSESHQRRDAVAIEPP